MSKKSLLAAALLLGLGTAAMAAPAQNTLTVVSGSGHVLVNGKEYVPGTPITNTDNISVTGGEVTMKIGDTVLSSQGGEFRYAIGLVSCTQGSVTVTPPGMGPMTATAGPYGSGVVFLPPPEPALPTPPTIPVSMLVAPSIGAGVVVAPPANPAQDVSVVSPSAP
ncbi:MAG: hypothetical protein KGO96_14305 [Elusimicrobia bacterium]|nr:hypothetical protein [Elusimicrobiota bacterium]